MRGVGAPMSQAPHGLCARCVDSDAGVLLGPGHTSCFRTALGGNRCVDRPSIVHICVKRQSVTRFISPGAHNLAVSPEPPSPPHSALSGCSLGHTPVHVHSGIHEDDDEGEEEDYNDEEGSSEVVDFEEGAYNYSDSDEWGGGGNGRLIAWVDNALHARRAMRCLSRWRRFVKQRNELFRGSWYFERWASRRS